MPRHFLDGDRYILLFLISSLQGTRKWNPDNEILIKKDQTSQLLEEARSYVRERISIGRPYTGTGLDSPAHDAHFIQTMREKGFINQTQEELINAFKEIKRQFDDHWSNYF